MSGHHSRYRDNYESQVYHAGCQVIAHQVKACQEIHKSSTDIRDWYEYRKIIQF